MQGLLRITTVLLSLVLISCAAGMWPSRANKSPGEMLVDAVRWQQGIEVRLSVGELADECFTDLDLQAFVRDRRPEKVVALLQSMSEFRAVAAALGGLSREVRAGEFAQARLTAHPTWAMLGRIDREGRGQTTAGREAELLLARAIADAFETASGGKL
jgi:hypothetical protein